jgi:hypothetical protein
LGAVFTSQTPPQKAQIGQQEQKGGLLLLFGVFFLLEDCYNPSMIIFWGNPCAFFWAKEFPPQMSKTTPRGGIYSELMATIHAAVLKRSVFLSSLIGLLDTHVANFQNLLFWGRGRPSRFALPVGSTPWDWGS